MTGTSGLIWLVFIIAMSLLLRPIGRRVPIAPIQHACTGMSLGGAFGYSIAIATIYLMCWLYFVKELIFFQWFVQGVIGLGIAGYLFRLAGQHFGTDGSRKMFRQMPVTAALGIIIIIGYAIMSIFADWLAPYGQAEIFAK